MRKDLDEVRDEQRYRDVLGDDYDKDAQPGESGYGPWENKNEAGEFGEAQVPEHDEEDQDIDRDTEVNVIKVMQDTMKADQAWERLSSHPVYLKLAEELEELKAAKEVVDEPDMVPI